MFEIPASGCLLLINAEMAPLLQRLGFLPLQHYLPYTNATLGRIADCVL